MAVHKGRSRGFFARAQQHPGGIAPGIAFQGHGPISVALVAEKLAVRVETCGPDPHPAFKIVVHADPHGGRMPPVALCILHGAAMARAGQESAGLV